MCNAIHPGRVPPPHIQRMNWPSRGRIQYNNYKCSCHEETRWTILPLTTTTATTKTVYDAGIRSWNERNACPAKGMAEVVITGQFLLATQRTDGRRPYQTGSASKATNKLSKRSNQQPRQQTQNRWDGQAGRQAGRQGLWVNRIPDRHTDAEANGKLQVCCNLVNGRGERTRTARNLCAFQEAPLFTGEDGGRGLVVRYTYYCRVECSSNYFFASKQLDLLHIFILAQKPWFTKLYYLLLHFLPHAHWLVVVVVPSFWPEVEDHTVRSQINKLIR